MKKIFILALILMSNIAFAQSEEEWKEMMDEYIDRQIDTITYVDLRTDSTSDDRIEIFARYNDEYFLINNDNQVLFEHIKQSLDDYRIARMHSPDLTKLLVEKTGNKALESVYTFYNLIKDPNAAAVREARKLTPPPKAKKNQKVVIFDN